jgi:hypothetical protein
MNAAENFVERLTQFIEEFSPRSVVIEDGIIKVVFEDGSYVDFTQPLAQSKPPQ